MKFQFSEDIKKEVFELTLALYRVTDFFPKNEVLRRSLREKANEIFGLITQYSYAGVEGEALHIFSRIEAMKGYLDIARRMRLVKPINLSVLYREYEFIGEFFKNESRLSDMKNTRASTTPPVSDMKEKERAPVSDYTGHRKTSENVEFSRTRSGTFSQANKPAKRESSGTSLHESKKSVDIGQKGSGGAITDRQKTIIDHLKTGEKKAKLGDIHSLFENVSSKTIQRDLQDLVSRNLLRKEGEKRWTTYFLQG